MLGKISQAGTGAMKVPGAQTWRTALGSKAIPEVGAPRVPGYLEQAGRETIAAPWTMGKFAWQNKPVVGAVAAPIGIASLWPE